MASSGGGERGEERASADPGASALPTPMEPDPKINKSSSANGLVNELLRNPSEGRARNRVPHAKSVMRACVRDGSPDRPGGSGKTARNAATRDGVGGEFSLCGSRLSAPTTAAKCTRGCTSAIRARKPIPVRSEFIIENR